MVVLIARDGRGRIVDVRLFPARHQAGAFLRERAQGAWSWEAAERCPEAESCPCRFRPVPLSALAPDSGESASDG